MADTSARLVPNCKVSVDGSPLDPPVQASLVRLSVDLDADLFSQTTLLFADPQMKLIGGDTFACGAAISVRIGYGAKLETIFDGEVVRLEPQFRKDQPISLVVVCQESMHRLALSQSTRSLNDVDVSDVVTQIAQDHGFSSEAPSGTKQHILQGNISNATMLRRLGHRLGLRVRVEGKKLIMGPPPSTDAIPLVMSDGIQKVKVKLKSGGQVSEIAVHGWDPKTKKEVVGKAKPQGEVGKGGKDYGGSTSIADSSGDNLPSDQASAEAMAKGRMTRLNEGFIKSQIEMIGDGRMTPGQKVDLDKMGPGIDGTWRIERAHHDFSRRGYFVKMEAVRVSAKKPAPPAAPAKKGDKPKQEKDKRLSRPRWKRRVDGQDDFADMAVEATKELEGKSVKFILETRVDGSWKEVATANGSVSSGTATASKKLEKLDTSAFTNPKWTAAKDSEHKSKDSGEVSMTAKAKDGIEVRVILEQQVGRGWEKVQQKSSSVKGGEVKATFTLAHPNESESGKDDSKLLKIPQWNQHPVTHGSSGSLQIRAPGLPDGRAVQFDVEQMGAEGIWKLVRTVQGAIDRGTAGVSLPDMRHPAHNEQPAHADVLTKPTWDAKTLVHGGTGKFSVQAEGLDGRVVAFIVERNDAGKWTQLIRATGKVSGGKAEASASFAHPTALTNVTAKPAARPKLGNPRWDAEKVAHNDSIIATIDATNLEGATIEFVAERHDHGGWVEAGRGQGVVKNGKASASIDVSHPTADTESPDAPDDGIAPKLVNPRWESASAAHGDSLTAIIDAEGLEGALVEFIAERLETGGWVEAGRANGAVSRGQATGSIAIQHPGGDNDQRKMRFSTQVLTNPKEPLSSPVPVKYDPKTGKATASTGGHFEGRQVRFIYEKKTALGWTVVKEVTANVSKALATAQLPTTAPKGTLTAPKWASNRLVHGDAAQCTVTAANLNGKKVKFVVERQQDDGTWIGVGAAIATVSNNKASATVPVSHPKSGESDAAAMAHLRFQVAPLDQSETRVRAQLLPDLAPRSLRFRAAVLDDPNEAEAELKTSFDPKTGIASAQVGGAGNPSVRFALQQKGVAGWATVATATGRSAGGKAQVSLPIHHTAGAKLVNPRWAQTALVHGDQANMVVDGKGLDGQRVKFFVEELVDGKWSEAGNSLAFVVGGQAKGSVAVMHKPGAAVHLNTLRFRAVLDAPELRVRGEMAADLDPKRLRFRSELIPDHTKQKLRFKAQPIPDLLPKKIRFRGELPVPQDPALTRLRCTVSGADEVKTGSA